MTLEQYRKLEFLKLFRLMKNLGYIKSKRKMPNDVDMLSGSKRLFKSFLKSLFPNSTIKSDYSCFTINFSTENQTALSNLFNQGRNYFDALGPDGAEALRRITLLKRYTSQYINNNYLPRYISIYPRGTDITNRLQNLINIGVPTARSSENFFYSAKKCIEIKSLMDEHIPFLVEFERTAETKRLEQERIKIEEKKQRRQAERDRLKLEAEKVPEVKIEVKQEVKQAPKTIEEIKKEAEVKINSAQLAFNRALEGFKGR